MFSLISILLFACEETKSSVDDCVGDDCISDTGSDSVDTGSSVDTGVTDTEDTEDTQDTQDTEDTSDTQDTEDTNDPEDTSVPETDDDGDGVTVEGGDCDDSNPNIPGDEYCDGVDNDCDGQTDEADAIDVLTWYIDQDGDGFGEATTTMEACEQPTGYADNTDDCDDSSALISPSMTEVWYDGVDQNCDGADDYDADGDGLDDRMVDITNTPQFVMELNPIGNNSGNALQGLAVDVERDELWMTVDTSSFYENVLLNRLSLRSGNPQYCEEYTESNNLGLGHGQDLSIEYTSGGQRKLWIGSEDDRGVTRINPDNMTIEVLSDLLPTGWSHTTPTIGLQGQWIAVRGSKDGDSVNHDWIRIYDKSAIENGFATGVAPSPLYSFNIAQQQRVSDMWFQGIALDEEAGLVYAITGDNTLNQSTKLLYVYDLNGNVVTNTGINMDWSTANALGSKYEPEGLSLVQDPNSHVRYLYFTMMFGSSGNNIKRLYAIAPSNIPVGGTYSNTDIDWLIRYNTNSGEVSIATALGDGELGCETKRSTWSNDWSSFVGYYVGGDPHLLLQKEVGGTTKIHPLDWEANLASATKNSSWSNGWSDFHTWEYGSSTYLFYYKSGSAYSGLMRTSKLTSSGETGTMYEDEYWSTGWNTHIYTLPNGDDFLLRYYQLNANVRLAPLGAGTIGSDIYNSTWGSSYTDFTSVQSAASTYVIARNSSGDLVSYQAQSNGLLSSTDTVTTSLSSWTSMTSYNLEGQALVHLYRASDGFFTLYEIDSSGMFQGPVESGFEENGWTGFEHFKTTP